MTAGGTPRADVKVTAYAAKPGGGWEYLRDVSTDSAADGTYALGGLPAGVYRVKFNAHDPELAPEFFNDKATLATADDVTVAAGAVTPDIDADLGAAGRITGHRDEPERGAAGRHLGHRVSGRRRGRVRVRERT